MPTDTTSSAPDIAIGPRIETQEVIQVAPATRAVLDKQLIGTLQTGAGWTPTPAVRNLTYLKLTNLGAQQINGFVGGATGQILHILGDGFTTVKNNFAVSLPTEVIFTATGADKVLQANKVYRFTRYPGATLSAPGIWYEDADITAAGGVVTGVPFSVGADTGCTLAVLRVSGAAHITTRLGVGFCPISSTPGIDVGGPIVPDADNNATRTVGTASFRWADLRTVLATFSGQITSTSTADPALLLTGGSADGTTFAYGQIASVGKFRIQRDGKISALSLGVQSGTDINAGSLVFSVANTGAITGLQLTLSAAASKIVPGATSLSLRNNADSADNLILTDAGLATLRNTVTLTSGNFIAGTNFLAQTSATGANSTDLMVNHTGAPASGNVQFALSIRSTNDVLWLFGYDGTTFKNMLAWDYANNRVQVGPSQTTIDLSLTSRLLFTTAASKIIPGATSISLRNNADSADNVLVSNAGIVTLRNDLTISTLSTFDSTGTRFGSVGSITAYDVLSYEGGAINKWRPRLLQTSWTAGVVTSQDNLDNTFAGFAFSVTYNNLTPAVPATPVLTPVYQGMIVDLGTTPPAGSSYVVDYSINGAAYSSNKIIMTSQKCVHSGLDTTKTYAYKAKGRGKADGTQDSAYSAATAATNPSTTTEANVYGLVVASQITAVYLSAIVANLGLITAGQIRNVSKTGVIQLDTTFALDAAAVNGLFFAGANPIPGQITGLGIDFTATGTNPLLKASKLLLNADGTAKFFGNVDITQSYSDVASWWISLRDTSVAHGMTSLAPTNMFAAFAFHNTSQGGLSIDSWTSGSAAMELLAIATTTVTGTTGGTLALTVGKKSGTSSVALAATDNAIWLNNSATTIALFKANGDTTLGGILQVADGAVGAPSYSFTNATTTGLFRIAAVGGFTLATSGVGLLSVTTSGGKNYLQRERAGGAVAVQQLGGVLSAVADSVVSTSGTGETDLKSYTVLANTLDETYRSIRFEAWGSASGNASLQTINVYYGGTKQLSFDNGSNASFRGWFVRGIIHYTGASAQEIWIEGGFGFPGPNGGTPRTIVDRALPGKSNTADEILKITGQAAGGSLSQYTFDVRYTP